MYRMTTPKRTQRRTFAALTSAAMLTAACTSGGGSGTGTASRSTSSPPSTPAPTVMIEQPVVTGIPVAPEAKRVDLVRPTFSDPTDVSNPLFPVSQQESVLLVGRVDDQPFRTEVTLLPYTRIISWGDEQIETLVIQYTAYLGGRIQEVAYDYYAQSDDGAVWYLGEDVADFEDGVIVTKEGTWTTGIDGPPAMIMPGNPEVGQVHRTENIPGIAFEEIIINSVDETVKGPFGPVADGLVSSELHMDSSVSDKVFAPGYGEFYSAHQGDVEALALAIPTDATDRPTPRSLITLAAAADTVGAAVDRGNWPQASGLTRSLSQAWQGYRTGDVPWRIEPLMSREVTRLARAVSQQDAVATREVAFELATRALDLQLLHRPATEVDLARFDLWAGRLVDDAAAADAAAVNGDLFTLEYIRDRILWDAPKSDVVAVDTALGDVMTGVLDSDLAAAGQAAERLRRVLATL